MLSERRPRRARYSLLNAYIVIWPMLDFSDCSLCLRCHTAFSNTRPECTFYFILRCLFRHTFFQNPLRPSQVQHAEALGRREDPQPWPSLRGTFVAGKANDQSPRDSGGDRFWHIHTRGRTEALCELHCVIAMPRLNGGCRGRV